MGKIFRAVSLLLGLAAPLAAQNILLVEHAGQMLPVRRAKGSRAMVEIKGRLVQASGQNFRLAKAEEFMPAFVAVQNLDVATSSKLLFGTTANINGNFDLTGDFESPFPLEDVFVAVTLDFNDGSRAIALREVGQMEPYRPIPFKLSIPVTGVLGKGMYQFHLFSGGQEVFQSELPFAFREQALDQMVAKRVAGLREAEAKPFVGPFPGYPAKLTGQKPSGSASVRFRIGRNGTVLDPEVTQATDPAFGEAALAAVRQWRFLPKIKDGHPVETQAEMPFAFEPPGHSRSHS